MRNHSQRVAAYAKAIGRRMRMGHSFIEGLHTAGLVHDIGKVAVPDAILAKPGPLTAEEFDVIRRHPETALEIIGQSAHMARERPVILHHHERWDGHGYPGGLAGSNIPIGARILAVADAIDAMFSARSYKPAYDLGRVRSELAAGAGTQFDPNVAETALKWLDETPTRHGENVHEMSTT